MVNHLESLSNPLVVAADTVVSPLLQVQVALVQLLATFLWA